MTDVEQFVRHDRLAGDLDRGKAGRCGIAMAADPNSKGIR